MQPGCDMRICMTMDPAGFICRSLLYTILKCSFQVLRYPDKADICFSRASEDIVALFTYRFSTFVIQCISY